MLWVPNPNTYVEMRIVQTEHRSYERMPLFSKVAHPIKIELVRHTNCKLDLALGLVSVNINNF